MLATAGTLAIHVLVAVFGDAMVLTHPPHHHNPAPRVELVDIEPPATYKEPPPPVEQPTAKPEEPKAALPPKPQKVARHAEPPPAEPKTPPPSSNVPPDPNSGGGPVTTMADVAPSATGVAVAKGPPSTGHIGRGGSGTGTGAGSGSGSASAPTPVSIATIKTRAMPRGDNSYWDAGKDYPAEAKSLGIEGVIRVRLIVDQHGKVKSAVLLNKLGHGLDEMALKRAQQIEFEPAKDTTDQPVTSVVVWTFNMELPK